MKLGFVHFQNDETATWSNSTAMESKLNNPVGMRV